MLPNHYVYKGYRLSANVERVLSGSDGGLDGVTFRASLRIMRADLSDEPGIECEVPAFSDGQGRHSPREAIHAAVEYGCQVVDALPAANPLGVVGVNTPG
jgi:hypothetical protein